MKVLSLVFQLMCNIAIELDNYKLYVYAMQREPVGASRLRHRVSANTDCHADYKDGFINDPKFEYLNLQII